MTKQYDSTGKEITVLESTIIKVMAISFVAGYSIGLITGIVWFLGW